MSAVASFVRLPKAALAGLEALVASRNAGSGASPDAYCEYLHKHGREVPNIDYSGFVLPTLLVYLHQRMGIDLMKSEYDQLATELTKARGGTHFVFTESHKVRFLNELNPQILSEVEMRDFFNEFNETSEQQVGIAMLDGVIALQVALSTVDHDSVLVFSIT